MFAERPSRIPGAVLWTRRSTAAAEHRILPDGCMDLIWRDGDLLVAGPDTVAYLARGRPGTHWAALRFPPGVAPAVLGVPADALRDRRVSLGDIWSAGRARRLAAAISSAATAHRAAGPMVAPAAAEIEQFALRRLAEEPPDPLAAAIPAQLRRGRPVAAIADQVGLSERQLHRRCLALFGYGAKRLARIQRLGHALTLAGTSASAVAAAEAGYADQAHFAREVRALAGVPLTTLLAG